MKGKPVESSRGGFREFVDANDRRCSVCIFFEKNKVIAQEIRKEMKENGRVGPSIISKYIKSLGFTLSEVSISDHFRRGHEEAR